MKILLIDHSFHKSTGSSRFFIDLLTPHFEVDHQYVDPECPDASPVFQGVPDHDLVVLWQFDFLAPYFLALGKRTVVVPMYDGSANMPPLHWQAAGEARFVNFSRTLHDRVAASGGQSLLVRFYPEPVPEAALPTFDRLRVFFWQRRPADIDVQKVHLMIGDCMDELHVHDAPDVESSLPSLAPRPPDARYTRTESRWLPSQKEYLELITRSNTYIAPRVAEGIGFGFLEAMARGMAVIASDAPTHTEYIANWTNGILFDHQRPSPFHLSPDDARRIGRMAWKSVQAGHEHWLKCLPGLIDWIANTPAPARRAPPVEGFLPSLCSSYLAGGTAYTSFLARHAMAPRKPEASGAAPVPDTEPRQPAVDDTPDGLVFGTGGACVSLLRGFQSVDAFSAVVAQASVAFAFRLNQGHPGQELSITGYKKETSGLALAAALDTQDPHVTALPDESGPFRVRVPLSAPAHGHCVVKLRLFDRRSLADAAVDGALRLTRIHKGTSPADAAGPQR